MQTTTRLRKGDVVQVMTGRSRGKSGKILRIDHAKARVYVENVQTVKRHVKPSQKQPQGGVVEKEASIHWSAVQLLCGHCAKPVRIRIKKSDNKGMQRLCIKCAHPIGN
ncbi:MAG: 50S ribosomal protein L24 [Deltaproteobacteria bacterium]|nr:50S ribosomal protein L24 [Deltaproteobacteria bacterium]